MVSDTHRSSFKFSATNMHDGAIMIGVDTVTLVVQHHGFVVTLTQSGVSALRVTTNESDAFKFKFDDLDKGRFTYDLDQLPSALYHYVSEGASEGVAAGGWELAS
jgi:hypothetical protein